MLHLDSSSLLALILLRLIVGSAADPCDRFDLSCRACVESIYGCRYCPADGTCSFEGVDRDLPYRCINDDEFVPSSGSCDVNNIYRPEFDGNMEDDKPFFNDPNYSTMGWVFKMVNVLPVWREGITGAGVRVRVNDFGLNHRHAEFAHRFDLAASCDDFSKAIDDSHGTLVASIVGAEANNGVCSVGLAPGVSISSCPIFNKFGFTASVLSEKMDMFDISQNSWIFYSCVPYIDDINGNSRRWLQSGECPFNPRLAGVYGNPCESCDFRKESTFDLSDRCSSSIHEHCKYENFLSQDSQACREFIDAYADRGRYCMYHTDSKNYLSALQEGVRQGRKGKGVVFVFASGNLALDGSSTNTNPFLSTRYSMSVGAVGQDGNIASYSEGSSSLFIAAPGGILFDNNYIEMVGAGIGNSLECEAIGPGTSFSSPIVSGVVALMLEVNGDLTWRDVQSILAATSRVPGYANTLEMDSVVKTSDNSQQLGDTITNAAGYTHSYSFGFGIVDAHAAVTASRGWIPIGEEVSLYASKIDKKIITDNKEAIKSSLRILVDDAKLGEDEEFFVEHVDVKINLNHSSRGDLDIHLTSPGGTVSRLLPGNRNENQKLNHSWEISTVRSRGESPFGEWTLSINDVSEGNFITCEDRPWSPPPLVNGCEVLEGLLYGCLAFARDDIARNRLDLNNQTANAACCGCGGGNFENGWCSNLPWVLDTLDEGCAFIRLSGQCPSHSIPDSLLDTIFVNGEGTGRESCCLCGGGFTDDRSTPNFLNSWSITVYGHIRSTLTDPPTATPSSVTAIGNLSFVLQLMIAMLMSFVMP